MASSVFGGRVKHGPNWWRQLWPMRRAGPAHDLNAVVWLSVPLTPRGPFYFERLSENFYLYQHPPIQLRRFFLARLRFRRASAAHSMFYSGERRGERHSKVVQFDQGIRLHSTRWRWRQRRIRAHLGGGKGGPQFADRGREGILRYCRESRQGIGRKSAGELGHRSTWVWSLVPL